MSNWNELLDDVGRHPGKQAVMGLFEKWNKNELPHPDAAQFNRLVRRVVAAGLIPESAGIEIREIYQIDRPKFSVDSHEVAMTLITRLISPKRIFQGQWGLCGPAAVAYLAAKNNKLEYAKFLRKLLKDGRATIQGKNCAPSRAVRRLDFAAEYGPKGTFAIPQADWVVLAGIQANEEGLADPEHWGAMTTSEIFHAFKAKQYRTVMWVRNQKRSPNDEIDRNKHYETGNFLKRKHDQPAIQILLSLFDNSDKLLPDWRVIMICNPRLLTSEISSASHAAALRRLSSTGEAPAGKVKAFKSDRREITFRAATWGRHYDDTVPYRVFDRLLYGFVAANIKKMDD